MSINDVLRASKTSVLAEAAAALKQDDKPLDYDPPPNDIPSTTWIEMEHKAANGATYRARVRYRVPNMSDLIAIGRLKTLLVGSGVRAYLDAEVVSHQLAYMQTCFETATLPSWWNPGDAHDWNPYGELFAKAVAYEATFLRGGTAQEPLSASTEDEESDAGRVADPVPSAVVGKVRRAPKRSEVLSPDPARGR